MWNKIDSIKTDGKIEDVYINIEKMKSKTKNKQRPSTAIPGSWSTNINSRSKFINSAGQKQNETLLFDDKKLIKESKVNPYDENDTKNYK